MKIDGFPSQFFNLGNRAIFFNNLFHIPAKPLHSKSIKSNRLGVFPDFLPTIFEETATSCLTNLFRRLDAVVSKFSGKLLTY